MGSCITVALQKEELPVSQETQSWLMMIILGEILIGWYIVSGESFSFKWT